MVILSRLNYNKIARIYNADIWGSILFIRRVNKIKIKTKLVKISSLFEPNFLKIYKKLYSRVRRFKVRGFFLLTGQKNFNYLKKRPLKFYTKMLIEKQKFKSYYLLRRDVDCQKLFDLSRKEFIRGNFYALFLFRLESRLISFLFRSNIYLTPLLASIAIKKGYIKVNNKIITKPTYNVKVGDYITFLPFAFDKKDFIFRSRLGLFKFKPMMWTFSSFYSFTFFIWRKPFFHELDFPFNFNLPLAFKYFKR